MPATVMAASDAPSSSEIGYTYRVDPQAGQSAAGFLGAVYLALASLTLIVIIFHKRIAMFARAVRKTMDLMDDSPSD